MNIYFSDQLVFPSPPDLEAFADWLFYGFCVAGIGFAVFYAVNLFLSKRRVSN